MVNKKQNFTAVLIMIGVLDLLLWTLTISQITGVVPPITFVLVRCGLTGAIIYVFYSRRSDALIAAILTSILFVAFSLFGILAMLLVIRFADQDSPQGGSLYHIDKEEGEHPDLDGALVESLVIEELRRVAPLVDGMTDEYKDNRIAAIQAMERVSDSTNIRKILLEAKLDPHKEVQYYANEALNKVNDSYMDQIKELLNTLNEIADPDNSVYLKLADLYGAVAQAGIDHPVLLRFYAQEAKKYYFYMLENLSENSNENVEQLLSKQDVLRNLLPTLYNNNEFEKCLDYCETAAQFQTLQALAYQYKARSLFRLKKLAALKEFCKDIQGSGVPNIDEFLELERA